MPLGIVSRCLRVRPAEQYAIGELLRSQTIQQRLRRLLTIQWRNASPTFSHGCKTLVLAVGKSQSLPQPLGIFWDGDSERAEPAHSIRLKPDRRLDLGHVLETSQIAHTTKHAKQQSRVGH